jgi:hypothetical protein
MAICDDSHNEADDQKEELAKQNLIETMHHSVHFGPSIIILCRANPE